MKAKLKPHEIPDLIVFSDMQFDQARISRCSRWETTHESIVRRFKEAGIRVCGEEWPAPHMIYWNLRGNTRGFPAKGNTPNVTMLSGFSPSLMKLLLDGETVKTNPFDTLRKALDDKAYDKVRSVLSRSKEGLLEYYKVPEKLGQEGSGHKEVNEEDWEIGELVGKEEDETASWEILE